MQREALHPGFSALVVVLGGGSSHSGGGGGSVCRGGLVAVILPVSHPQVEVFGPVALGSGRGRGVVGLLLDQLGDVLLVLQPPNADKRSTKLRHALGALSTTPATRLDSAKSSPGGGGGTATLC